MIYAIIIVGLALDQLTKYITVANLKGADSVVLAVLEDINISLFLFLWLHFLEFYFIYIKIRIKCLKLNKYYLL